MLERYAIFDACKGENMLKEHEIVIVEFDIADGNPQCMRKSKSNSK